MTAACGRRLGCRADHGRRPPKAGVRSHHVQSFPFSINCCCPTAGFAHPSARARQLLRTEPDGSLVIHSDLAAISENPGTKSVVDGRGNAYLNNIGFDFPDGQVGRESSRW